VDLAKHVLATAGKTQHPHLTLALEAPGLVHHGLLPLAPLAFLGRPLLLHFQLHQALF
jgi:hypothetical protein